MKTFIVTSVWLGLCLPLFAQSFSDSIKIATSAIEKLALSAKGNSAPVCQDWPIVPQVIGTGNLDKPESLARCDNFTLLSCGQTVSGTTIGAGNDFVRADYGNCLSGITDPFDAPDLLYKIVMTQSTNVHFVLNIFGNADLDMFLFNGCEGSCINRSVEDNTSTPTTFKEVFDTYLVAGQTYYLLIDGYNVNQAASFNLTMNCSACTCVEGTIDPPAGIVPFCDNIEDFEPNKPITKQGSRWYKWPNNYPSGYQAADATVKQDAATGNKYVHVQKSGAVPSDVLYWLSNQTSGRYRLSFQLLPTGSNGALYGIFHDTPLDDAFYNVAFWVFFNPSTLAEGDANLIYGPGGSANTKSFKYKRNKWLKIVNILDLDMDVAELWIDNQFIFSWKFSLGNNAATQKKLAALQLWSGNTSTVRDFYVDNICFWADEDDCKIAAFGDTVCVKNGVRYPYESWASCDLYIPSEWELCYNVCDFGGSYIYRQQQVAGKIDPSDFAASLLKYDACIQSAYNNNPPNPLYADSYIFYKNDNKPVQINFNNFGNQQVKYNVYSCNWQDIGPQLGSGDKPENIACVKSTKCIQDPDGDGTFSPPPCDNYYYIVVTGTLGATYTLQIIPDGDCDQGITPISCGANISATVNNSSQDNFRVDISNSAYKKCYNSTRTYTGGEKVYKLVVTDPSTVTITMSAPTPMGLFIYSFLCGQECIGYSENTAFNPEATFIRYLIPGTYFVVIDQATVQANKSFTLKVNCKTGSNFTEKVLFIQNDGLPDCPLNSAQQHQILLLNNAYEFTAGKDQINLLYRDTVPNRNLRGADTLSWYFTPGATFMPLNFYGDLPNDDPKCSYRTGDTIFLILSKIKDGQRRFGEFNITYENPGSNGANATNRFRPGGTTIIKSLREKLWTTFGTETSLLTPPPTAGSGLLRFSTNLSWDVTGSTNWLTITPTENNEGGNTDVNLTWAVNDSALPRRTILEFKSKKFPTVYRQYVLVEQLGNCVNATVTVQTAKTTICAGDEITLTPNVDQNGVALKDLYTYKWNTGDTSRIIKVKPTANTTYTVSITNRYCFKTGTSSLPIVVNPLPLAPNTPGNKSMCLNGIVPNLTANPPTGLPATALKWFETSSSTTVLQTGNSYQPNPAPSTTTTYYVETQVGDCKSATRLPVKLTVNPLPTLNVSQPSCDPSLLTYRVNVTTNGTGITATAGTVEGSNGTYLVKDIAKGVNVNITAVNEFECIKSQSVNAPTCICSTPNPPTPGSNQSICAGQPKPKLSVTVGPNETVDWYDAAQNGKKIRTDSLSITPDSAGTFFAQTRNKINQCTSVLRTPMSLTINPLPTFVFLDTACAADRKTYSLVFTLNNGNTASATEGNLSLNGTTFTLGQIMSGKTAVVTAKSVNNCSRIVNVLSPVCECPVVLPPTSSGNRTICENEAIPSLAVSVGANEDVEWFDALQNGMKIGQGTSYKPPKAGTYYAQTRNLLSDCISNSRTVVSLIIHPLPKLIVTDTFCSPDLKSYTLNIATGNANVTSNAGSIFGGNGNFTINNVPKSVNVVLLLTDLTTGCKNEVTFQAPNCPCPIIPPAVSGGNKTICAGDSIPELSVNTSGNNTVRWFDAFGQLLADTSLTFKPSTAGIYFAEAYSEASGCKSDTKISVELKINALPTLTVVSKNCSQDLKTYEVRISTNANAIVQSNGDLSGSAGNYLISNIKADSSVKITASNTNTGCSIQQIVSSPKCVCTVFPSAPGFVSNAEVCADKPLPALSVNVGNNEVVNWYNQFGQLLQTANPYTPPAAGTYFAEAQNSTNGCVSKTRTEVSLKINALPFLNVLDTLCSDDLSKYTINLLTNATDVKAPPFNPNIIANGGGSFSIVDVPFGSTVNITARIPVTGCETKLSVKKLDCPCPVLAAPISNGDKTICKGSPMPLISVSVADTASETVVWYRSATGGFPISGGTNKLAFVPPVITQTDTFFAQTRSKKTDISCISLSRTPVIVYINEPVIVEAGVNQVVCQNEVVTLTGNISSGISGYWEANKPGGIFSPGPSAAIAKTYSTPLADGKVTLYLISEDPAGPCPAARDSVIVTVNPLPTYKLDSNYCVPNLKTYTVVFSTSGNEISVNEGTITNLGLGKYRISGIDKAKNLTILGENKETKCVSNYTVNTTGCPCPALAEPKWIENKTICEGEAIPFLEVQGQQTLSVNWYNQAGNKVATNTPKFKPQFAGVYFAETVDTVSACVSAQRTPVTLIIKKSPIANAGQDTSICPGFVANLKAVFISGYNYQWSNGSSLSNIEVRPKQDQNFILRVTFDGCQAQDTVLIKVFPEVSASIKADKLLLCHGDANGQLSIGVSGGKDPYSLKWSNGKLDPVISNLPKGIYSVIVTDQNTCRDTAVFDLKEPLPLALADTIIVKTSGTNDGKITVLVGGGTPPYEYEWYREGFQFKPYSPNNTIDSLLAAKYKVKVSDANGCTFLSGDLLLIVPVSDPFSDEMITVNPNPTTGMVYLGFDLSENRQLDLLVSDLLGRTLIVGPSLLVQQQVLELDLGELPDGVYLIQIRIDGIPLTKKLVVQR